MKTIPTADGETNTGDNEFDIPTGSQLRTFIERIEVVQEEIDGLRADIKEIKIEAKGVGFDVKVINYLIRIRKQDADDLAEFEALVETYKRALG